MQDNQIKSCIKFRQTDNVTIVFAANDNKQNISHITIGPLIDRVRCFKAFYAITTEDNPSIQELLKEQFNVSLKLETDTCFTINYKEFKKYFKITYARELTNLGSLMSDDELISDLDFMKNEIVTCQINMNILKQKGDMIKYAFYDNMINNQQHLMFQIPTTVQYAAYLDKIANLLDKNDVNVTQKEKEKKIMNDVMDVSNNIW